MLALKGQVTHTHTHPPKKRGGSQKCQEDGSNDMNCCRKVNRGTETGLWNDKLRG